MTNENILFQLCQYALEGVKSVCYNAQGLNRGNLYKLVSKLHITSEAPPTPILYAINKGFVHQSHYSILREQYRLVFIRSNKSSKRLQSPHQPGPFDPHIQLRRILRACVRLSVSRVKFARLSRLVKSSPAMASS